MTKPRESMGPRKAPPGKAKDITRTRLTVLAAGLVGISWPDKRVSSSVYEMPKPLLKDLAYWMNRRVAFIVCRADPNGAGWEHLVCWPGRGMFVVKLGLEDVA